MVLGKAAIAVLAAAVMFGGLVGCPRSGLACPMHKAMSGHRCCDHHSTLQATDCCTHGSQAPAVKAGSTDPEQRPSGKLLVAVAWQTMATTSVAQVRVPLWCQARYGPAPPHTPVSEHTALLL